MVAPDEKAGLKVLRGLFEDAKAIDAVVVVLSTWFVLGAYVTAYAYVHVQGEVLAGPQRAGFTMVTAAWSLLTLFLFACFANGLGKGRPWNRALPDGQTGTFTAALVFGAAWIVDAGFWSPFFGTNGVGLDSLYTPPHLIEMAAAAIIVTGPVRAAARRGETAATPVTLTSAALLLSVLTFATQFAHPLIDPWPAGNYEFRAQAQALPWLGENIGMASLLAQTAILAGTALLLNSAFKLRPGALTFVFALNGVLVCITKWHFELLPVPIAAGVAADAWLVWSARRPGHPTASLCAVVGFGFTLAYAIEIALLPAGSTWGASLWIGAVIASTMFCWLMGRLLRAGMPSAVIEPYLALPGTEPLPERWTLDPDSTVREQIVRAALDDLGTPEALGRSPLCRLPSLSDSDSAAAELRALLIDVIGELASAGGPRDAESGRLLLDYYVKKAGSHEVIMERLHLSRPTYYRRLHHGFELVANRLDQLSLARSSPARG